MPNYFPNSPDKMPDDLSEPEQKIWQSIHEGKKNWYSVDEVAATSGVRTEEIINIFDDKPKVFLGDKTSKGFFCNTVSNYREKTGLIDSFLDFSAGSFYSSTSTSIGSANIDGLDDL